MSHSDEQSKYGRPRDKFPILDSMIQASALIGCPIELIKLVKRSKLCPQAFLRGDRIDIGLLLPAIFKQLETPGLLPDGVTTPQGWLALEKARREKIAREKDENEVIETSTAIRHASEAGGYFMQSLETICRELPPMLAGQPTDKIAMVLETHVERIRSRMMEKLNEIGKVTVRPMAKINLSGVNG